MQLRAVTLSDATLLWRWRNAPQTREQSFNSLPISLEDHTRWLKEKLAQPDCVMLIGEVESVPVGVIRFEKRESGSDVSVSVRRPGEGLGTKLLLAGCKHAPANPVHAFIKPGNRSSVRAFEKAGFTYVDEDSGSLHYRLDEVP